MQKPGSSYQTKDFDVFLCYNSSDTPAACQLALQLSERGVRAWLDIWELRPGLSWQQAIETQIENTKTVAVLIGQDGIGPWQRMEVEAGIQKFIAYTCPIIPVILQEAPPSIQLPMFLSTIQSVDFRATDVAYALHLLICGIKGIQPGRWQPGR